MGMRSVQLADIDDAFILVIYVLWFALPLEMQQLLARHALLERIHGSSIALPLSLN